MAFALISGARHSLHPTHNGQTSNDAAGFASCYGPLGRSPTRAFDTGLRPCRFPHKAASLLPGHLAATRTGLTPASDDELTTKDHLHKVTSDLLSRERSRLTAVEQRALNDVLHDRCDPLVGNVRLDLHHGLRQSVEHGDEHRRSDVDIQGISSRHPS